MCVMARCVNAVLKKLNSVSSNESYGELDDSILSPEEQKAKELYYRSIFEMVSLILYRPIFDMFLYIDLQELKLVDIELYLYKFNEIITIFHLN